MDDRSGGPSEPVPEHGAPTRFQGVGPVESLAIRDEIEQVVIQQQGGLGDVYRRTLAGETPDQIRIARGAERPNFVWNYNRTARALIDGDLPTAPTIAEGIARTFPEAS